MKNLIALLLCSSIITYSCKISDRSDSSIEVVQEENNYSEVPLNTEKIDDGFYLIINTWEDSSIVNPSYGKIISYSHDFLDDNTKNQPIFLEVDTSEFVPLLLSKSPEGIEQTDKRLNLLLSMVDSASVMLERFTKKHVNKKTCIVIGSKAVTMHKIREEITGGKLQITRCTDNACEYLLLELKDNVEN